MRIFKTADGLAISLPPDVVEALHLAEGDAMEILASGARSATIEKILNPEAMVTKLQNLPRLFPVGFVFDREEANER